MPQRGDHMSRPSEGPGRRPRGSSSGSRRWTLLPRAADDLRRSSVGGRGQCPGFGRRARVGRSADPPAMISRSGRTTGQGRGFRIDPCARPIPCLSALRGRHGGSGRGGNPPCPPALDTCCAHCWTGCLRRNQAPPVAGARQGRGAPSSCRVTSPAPPALFPAFTSPHLLRQVPLLLPPKACAQIRSLRTCEPERLTFPETGPIRVVSIRTRRKFRLDSLPVLLRNQPFSAPASTPRMKYLPRNRNASSGTPTVRREAAICRL